MDTALVMAFIAVISLINAFYAAKNQREYNQLQLCHAELDALRVQFAAHQVATKAEGDRLRERIHALEEHNAALYSEIAQLAARLNGGKQ